MTTIKIVNTQTGEETEREMNADELAQQAIDKQTAIDAKNAAIAKAAEKAALLERLGITADEAALLLG